MAGSGDNRRSRRILVQGEVDGGGSTPFKALVVNLSHEGVCVETAARLEAGQVCEFKFRIPPMTFAVRARVVWSNAHGRHGSPSGGVALFRSGAEFVGISDDARAILDTVVARPPQPGRPAPQKAEDPGGS